MLDSFDKGWFVLQTYSGYENKVKENLLQRAQTYNMLENILRVEIPTQTVNVEKNGKVKEVEENRFPGVEIENNKVKIMINMFGSETAAELELYQIAEL